MVPILRGVSNAGGTTNFIVFSSPSGLAVGDVMLAAISMGAQTPPSGWTQLMVPTGDLVCWAKIATSADVASGVFQWTGSGGDVGGVMAAYYETLGWGNISTNSNIADTVFIPSVNVQNDDTKVVALIGSYNYTLVTSTTNGYVSRVNAAYAHGAYMADKENIMAGASGTASAFLNSSQFWEVLAVELIPSKNVGFRVAPTTPSVDHLQLVALFSLATSSPVAVPSPPTGKGLTWSLVSGQVAPNNISVSWFRAVATNPTSAAFAIGGWSNGTIPHNYWFLPVEVIEGAIGNNGAAAIGNIYIEDGFSTFATGNPIVHRNIRSRYIDALIVWAQNLDIPTIYQHPDVALYGPSLISDSQIGWHSYGIDRLTTQPANIPAWGWNAPVTGLPAAFRNFEVEILPASRSQVLLLDEDA